MLVSGFVLAVAVSGLTACRTSPNVAAYVGDEQVTVTELETAVDARLEDPELAAFAAEQPDAVHPPGAVAAGGGGGPRRGRRALRRARSTTTTSGAASRTCSPGATRTPSTASSPSAGIGRADVFETVRQQLVRQEIAEAEGEAEEPTEAELQARYEEVREELAEVSFGYITVPDEATAAGVLAQLTADPASYPAVAAQFPSPTTLPALETRAPGRRAAAAGRGHRRGRAEHRLLHARPRGRRRRRHLRGAARCTPSFEERAAPARAGGGGRGRRRPAARWSTPSGRTSASR